jgi:hypothetical protein
MDTPKLVEEFVSLNALAKSDRLDHVQRVRWESLKQMLIAAQRDGVPERRSRPRISARFECLVIHQGLTYRAHTKDVSGEGANLIIQGALDVGSDAGLIVELPRGAIAARCRVVRSDSASLEHAVVFSGLLQRDKERIEALAAERQKHDR